ncbi:MAG: pyridoxal 5'-phosphate synthase glutaminase subunit PdxT [Nitrosopumilus sp. B06]|nr:MAG: pyridoxal 5'-phosphate synthase glutaminase subunit PdxT [Nitrosopumilus sp. D6]RNJ80402.1 MAG: pyridoxal 5'-phosphate synthase glutaminase subunit PdxT [Nitrosopumilus sp. B06]
MKIGILSIQGDTRENEMAVECALQEMNLDGKAMPVKTAKEIDCVDALVLPGGESTTIGTMCQEDGLLGIIKDKIDSGMPVLGICAGLVLLSGAVSDKVTGMTQQPLLQALDVTLERNSFGRQIYSFEKEISLDAIGIPRFNGVFIRAPTISEAKNTEILSRIDQNITAVKKDKIIATAFHPELAGDTSVHKYFIGLI